jgi:hypothetical protein
MLALEERLSQSQEGYAFGLWTRYLVRILCEVPEEPAWSKVDHILERVRANTSGMPSISLAVPGLQARMALVRGQLQKAEELSRAAMGLSAIAPILWILSVPVHIRALLGLGRAAEACLIAEQVVHALATCGGAGALEVEARLAVAEAFEASGDHARACAELLETLRQVALRADDIADPFWKDSYLTRNPYVARALSLGPAFGLPPLGAVAGGHSGS